MSYGEQKKIPYNSDLHRFLLPRLQSRIKRARDAFVAHRHDAWAKAEEQFMAYMPAKVNDRLRETEKKAGNPQFVTLEIPYSYAILLTAHTYITSTFLARDPLLQIKGRHGESQNAEMAMEALLDYQVQVGKHLVPYYIWTLDALKYGLGVISYAWREEQVKVKRRVKKPRQFFGVDIPGTEQTVDQEEIIRGFVGCEAFNVRPQDFFPDPSYPVHDFQKGEFVGRYVSLSFLDLKDGQARGDYFNIDFIGRNRAANVRLREQGSSQIILPDTDNNFGPYDDDTIGNIDGIEICVRLVPHEWRLGSGKTSEKWVFTVANDNVIISARPMGYYHDRYPFEVLECEIDGHALFTRSMLEVTKPLNDTLTWLINTHFFNVRKALNDQLIVDPSRVVMKDVTDPNPGRLIRLKPSAYGTDVRLAVNQLEVHDVTRAHLNDAQMVVEMLQRVTGVNDNIMGMLNSGRRTAQEVRTSTTFGVNRLKTVTEYMSAMGFAPWTQQLVQTTQQCYDDDRKYRIVGNLAQFGEKFLNVTPEQITGFYDFVPVDGTMPVDRFAQVNLWNSLMQQAAALPQIMQQYDFARIFGFVAQLAGLKNIDQFRVQVVPDATMQNQVQAGNSVPAVADPTALEQIPGPQLEGMGPSL